MMRLGRRNFSSGWVRPTRTDYLKETLESRVYDVAVKTPLVLAPALANSIPGNHTIFFKREDLQPTFSFNVRGAHNKIAHLTEKQRRKGIIACSAGNHAQGVAFSASTLGIDTTIVLPEGSSKSKVDEVKKYGARVIYHGEDFDSSLKEAYRLAQLEGRTLIHPFDDPLVIAGQATIAMEVLKQSSKTLPDVIFAPVGGGGLLSGVAAFIKAIAPSVSVIGVETEGSNPMEKSLQAGERVYLSESINVFTDEAAVRSVGEENFRICKSNVDDIITVSTDEICAAIKDVFGDTRSVMEPLGAISVAGLKKYCSINSQDSGKTLVAILAAANMDFDRLRFVSERADDKERFMSVTIPEARGSFQNLYNLIYPYNVTEFSYRMHSEKDKDAHICMSIQTPDTVCFSNKIKEINATDGMEAVDLSTNELAKSHVRHLVGGRVSNVSNERLFRIEFPERPGALKEFLAALGKPVENEEECGCWNVSLFHYRNHGADIGRVLVGFQVKGADNKEENQRFDQFLQKLQFNFVEETCNPLYQQFLQ